MKNRKIGIIGYGIIGQQIEYLLRENYVEPKTTFFYFDDILYKKGDDNCFMFSDFDKSEFKDLEFYVGLGYLHLEKRKNVCEQLTKNKCKFPYLIHKTAYIHPSAFIGNGVIIYPMSNIGFNVRLEDGVIVNKSAVVSHDSVVGTCSFISPGSILSGNVQIGSQSFLGSGTVISNGLRIGKNVKIGVGSVITKDIGDGLLAIGNPARIVNQLDIK